MSSTTYYYIAVRKINGKESYDCGTLALRAIDTQEKARYISAHCPHLPPVARIARVKLEEVKE